MTDHADFTTFLARRAAASDAFVRGDVAPLLEVSTPLAPATIFGPAGTVVEGPERVDAGNAAGSARFTGAERNVLEESHSGVEGSLGYWVGVQRSVVHVAGSPDPVTFDLRVTELYRHEDGEWRLFHRHADPLAQEE